FGEGCPVDWKKGDKGVTTTTQMEGKLELKKSWSEWARPKLNRAWSGASQRSITSVMSIPNTPGRSIPHEYLPHSAGVSGRQSPMVSPTSGGNGQKDMEEAMLLQQMENINAAMQNQQMENINAAMQNQSLGVGVAS
ncbi:cTPxI, partial [Teratosphaeriaceae sp. CCFEE 6253]